MDASRKLTHQFMTPLKTLKQKPVYLYTEASIAPGGQGSAVRVYTNLRAYIDLGFQVEVIQFTRADKNEAPPTPDMPNVHWTRVEYTPQRQGWAQRIARYAGISKNLMLDVLFPIKPFVVKQIQMREKNVPNAIHHFEYDNLASAAVAFRGLNAIWSHHDTLSTRVPLLREMRKEFVTEPAHQSEAVRAKQLRDSEDWIANSVKLILNIAIHEQQEFQQRGYRHAEFFPMSWADESSALRKRGWMADGKLRLLHLGSVDGFIGYDSLKFILEKVFPLLAPDALNNIELLVAGKMSSSVFSQKICVLAKAYPQVKFLGFVDDVKALYGECDLQVVGGIRATGMRTRIIESFVFGVPVLSTTESARGVAYLAHNENILLADEPPAFAAELQTLTPQKLDSLAQSARQTYDQFYARPVAAAKLAELLEKYL